MKKFRIWNKEGQWFLPDDLLKTFLVNYEGKVICPTSLDLEEFYENKKSVIQFSTGIKDKNGKEIYEGDIFQGFDEMGGEVLGEIKYVSGGFRVDVEQPKSFKVVVHLENWHNNGKIIGNIFENPELLKK